MDEWKSKAQILAYFFTRASAEDKIRAAKSVEDTFSGCNLRGTPACPGLCEAASRLKYAYESTGEGLDFRHLSATSELSITPDLENAPRTLATVLDLIAQEGKRQIRQDVGVQLLDTLKRIHSIDSVELTENLEKVLHQVSSSEAPPIPELSIKELYLERLKRPKGPRTYVRAVDERIEGLEFGTILTIAGFVGSFKTTWLLNIAYNNAIYQKFNAVYLTLEVTKDILWLELCSRHSYHPKFSEIHDPVPTKDLVQGLVLPGTPEFDFIFDTVAPDLESNPAYGKVLILEEKDLKSLKSKDIQGMLEARSFKPHIFILDYIQLLRYADVALKVGDIASIDYYVRQFAEMAKSCNGERIVIILASQTNRKGHEGAQKNEGKYELRALSEARELERSSKYVMFSFSTPDMIEAGEVKVQLLKNTFGPVMTEPVITFVNPIYSYIGDPQGFNAQVDSDNLMNMFDMGV